MTEQEREYGRHIRKHRSGPTWPHSHITAGEREDLVITRDRVLGLHHEKTTDGDLLCVPGRYMCGEYSPSRLDTKKGLFVYRLMNAISSSDSSF